MADSRAGAGNLRKEPGTSFCSRKWESAQRTVCQKARSETILLSKSMIESVPVVEPVGFITHYSESKHTPWGTMECLIRGCQKNLL